jgi:hypothetical protein
LRAGDLLTGDFLPVIVGDKSGLLASNAVEASSMKKPVFTVGGVLAAASFVFAGYLLLANFSDLRRYIRISTM